MKCLLPPGVCRQTKTGHARRCAPCVVELLLERECIDEGRSSRKGIYDLVSNISSRICYIYLPADWSHIALFFNGPF